MTIKMIAPGNAAGLNVTCGLTGNSYTSDANGLINAATSDVNSLEGAGFLPLQANAVITMTISTAAGVSIVPNVINLVPASTVAAIAVLPVPPTGTIGQLTRIVCASTGNVVITSSACSLLDNVAASATVLTCGKGIVDLVSVGSTLYQIVNRTLNTSSGGPVYGVLSS